jgi:hypothetical protein
MGTPTFGDYVELLFTRLERFRQHEAVTLKISDPVGSKNWNAS